MASPEGVQKLDCGPETARVLQRKQNGERADRLRLVANEERVSFAFEEVETGLSEILSEFDCAAKDKPTRAPRSRKVFAAHLECIEEVIEPAISAGVKVLEKVLIDQDRWEHLGVLPPTFSVVVTRCPKYAFRSSDGAVQALTPTHLIEDGLPPYIAVSKYSGSLPLYRQEAIYLGAEISRSLMAQWIEHLGFKLRMLTDYNQDRVKQGGRIFCRRDDPAGSCAPFGENQKAYERDDRAYGGTSPPMVAYRLEDSKVRIA